MCTVSFIPQGDKVFITSNRDEHISRKTKLKPQEDTINGLKVFYPKDKTAGGTWYAANENGVVAVLLNGAFNNHQRTPPYRKSRGLIVLEIVSSKNTVDYLEKISLEAIEPFTLILYTKLGLWEFRWDGKRKHLKELNRTQSYIWSSWTLYNKEAQEQRNTYFETFIKGNEYFGSNEILDFHQENHGDFENGFVVDRKNGLQTLSVTQVVADKFNSTLTHYDLDSGEKESAIILPTPLVSSRL